MEKSNSIWGNVGLLLISLIVFIFTFPEIDPSFGPGIDSPLAWAYNYLFAYDVEIFPQMVFPHGPVAFIMYPLPFGNNLDIAFWVLSITKIIFIYTLLRLGSTVAPDKWLLQVALVIMLAEILHINLILTGTAAAALMIFHFTEKRWWLIIPVVFTVIGLYTRASIGITNSIIMVSYAVIYVYQKKDYKLPLYTIGSFAVLLALFWLMVYGSFEGFFTYFNGTLQLTGGSSAATSYYPDNNWWLLGIAIVLFFALPFIAKNKTVSFAYGLFGLSIFAVWKHGMSREDLLHARGFFCYLVLFFTLILLALDEHKKRYFIIMGIILGLVYKNLTVTSDYREYHPEIWSVNQFWHWLNDRDAIGEEAMRQSLTAVSVHKLPDEMVNRIGNTAVDVYPWDFSFIPANNLKWHPRIVPQAYAAYTPWLDKQNADYFETHKGAEFIIWDMTEDRWGGNFAGIDDRYVLNNEPQSILKILDNYTVVSKCNKAILFEKDKGDHVGETKTTGELITTQWNQWVKVPEVEDGIQRVRLNMDGTFWRFMKNQLFKDEQYSIEYKLNNGEVKKYRIVPDIAAIGLWVNPLIMQPQNDFVEPLVTDIRFTCSNYKAVKDEIRLQWELTEVKPRATENELTGKFKNAFGLFGKSIDLRQEAIFSSLNNIETAEKYWIQDNARVVKGDAYSGDKMYKLEKGAFSHTFEFLLDSLHNDSLSEAMVSVNAAINIDKGGQLALVVSIEDENGQYFWNAVNTDRLDVEKGGWQYLYIRKKAEIRKGAKMKAFVWNTGDKEAYVDDIEVKIFH